MDKKGTSKKKTGISITVVCFAVFGVWMFVLGVMVGRGSFPIKFDVEKDKPAIVQSSKKQSKKKEVPVLKQEKKAQTEVAFYEELDKPIEYSKPNIAEKKVTAKKKIIKIAKKPEAIVVVKKKSPDKKKVSRSGFVIQVAALKNKVDAGNKAVDMNKQKYPAFIVEGKSGKDTWYRVRVGPFKTRAAAEKVLRRMKKEKIDAFVLKQ